MNTKRILLVIALMASLTGLRAQAPDEDIVLKAMQDELARSMTELHETGKDKPFFILYGLNDVRWHRVSANFGSLVDSEEAHRLSSNSSRVLVGSYDFNDESLENNLFSDPTFRDIALPIDEDYHGIRRSYWSITDNVYRSAARIFEKHKETLVETGKDLDEIPHRSFAKVEPVKLVITQPLTVFDRRQWEASARTLSGIALSQPEVTNSTATFLLIDGHSYIVNSEGTVIKVPVRFATVVIASLFRNSKGESRYAQVSHVAKLPEQIPTSEALRKEVEEMHNQMRKDLEAPALEQDYEGPVLLTGQAAAFSFLSLAGGREGLVATDQIQGLTGFQFDDDFVSMDGKLGKTIINESITIKAKPHLTTYGGVELLGAFEVDVEGVRPADEIVLIENGILKTLMNNRTITNPSQVANGLGSGPGVLEVTIRKKDPEKALRDKLIAEAKAQGLAYGMIVSVIGSRQATYKVFVSDGHEELVRNAMIRSDRIKSLRKVMSASETYKAYNISSLLGYGDAGRSQFSETSVHSIIAPESVLIESMEISAARVPYVKEERYVSRPVN